MDDPLSQIANENHTAIEEDLQSTNNAETEIQIPQDVAVEEEVEEKDQEQEKELKLKEAPTSLVFNLSSYDVTQEPNDIVQVTRVF